MDSSISTAQIVVEYDEIDGEDCIVGKLVKKLSISCQKVEESSKGLKSLKGQKNLQGPLVRRNVYQSTDPLSVHKYEKLELTSELW